MYSKSTYPSPLGEITIASDGESLIGLWLESQKYFANSISEEMIVNDNLSIFEDTKIWLDKYFSGKNPAISDLKLSPIGSVFRKDVWEILCKIPYGKTITYGDIAKQIAAKHNKTTMSAQAVGGAVGHNPISIIIPCHRVMGANNNLTGYAGGIDKKIWLLEHEGVDVSKLIVPKKGTAL